MVCRLLAPVIEQLLQLVHDFTGFLQEDFQYFRIDRFLLGLFSGSSGLFGGHFVGHPEVLNQVRIGLGLAALFQAVEHGLQAAQCPVAELQQRLLVIGPGDEGIQSVGPGFCQVGNRIDVRKPCATLEGMQFLLQLGQSGQFLRLVAPLVQTLANGVVDFQAFVQEDAD